MRHTIFNIFLTRVVSVVENLSSGKRDIQLAIDEISFKNLLSHWNLDFITSI